MKQIKCSFCGSSSDQVHHIVTADSHAAAICDECVKAIHEILETSDEEAIENTDLKKPEEIKKFLDEYVIAQEDAKKKASVAIYNHLKQNKYNANLKDKEPLEMCNVIMLGSSGSGKTLIWKTIAKLMSTIFVSVDCSALTEVGYVGKDPADMLVAAIKEANGDIQLAQRAIIFLDEFDKLARKSGAESSVTKDVSGESVQQGLLKILEGSDVVVSMSGKKNVLIENNVTINTSNMLFVLNGAFEGLDKIIARRINKKVIGFGEEQKEYTKTDLLKHVTAHDLIEFGILPEITSRAPAIITLDDLTENDLIRILTEPKNALIKQYAELFKMDNVNLTFKQEALNKIAKQAIKRKLNARGLRAEVNDILSPLMYSIPQRDDIKEIIISEAL